MTQKNLTALTLAAALAGAASFAAPVFAMDDAMGKMDSMSSGKMAAHDYDGRCWGVAKAGENDCGSKAQELKTTFGIEAPATAHDCAGHATKNYDGLDFKKVKAAADCTAMHGSLTPFAGMNDKMGM